MRIKSCTIMLGLALCSLGANAFADPIDEISDAIFEKNSTPVKIKAEFRKCLSDVDCTSLLSLCRWRPTNKTSEKYVADISSKAQLPCIWPPPPEQGPVVRCIEQLCDVPADGKYY
jgi:hypothetical protein